MSIYEKNEGKTMLKTAKYFKGDYVSLGVLKTVISVTVAFVVIVILVALCQADSLAENVNSIDWYPPDPDIIFYYRNLIHKISLAGKEVLFLLTVTNFSWERKWIVDCFNHRPFTETLKAVNEVSFLLEESNGKAACKSAFHLLPTGVALSVTHLGKQRG